ncbi:MULTISPECIES: hypothetical protein [unclassified Streptomyces]|uniref:Pirin n=1 Tax=Streptomyces sp. NBC_00119 TaxID=2975659 RepID=A0AAU1UHZ3_9ACTN|nr:MULTISPECIES: hypothetical protein [unclassified Streptomyces]MCX5320187.1 hypothetical protein [Streptomyces sp. NBC_00120]
MKAPTPGFLWPFGQPAFASWIIYARPDKDRPGTFADLHHHPGEVVAQDERETVPL